MAGLVFGCIAPHPPVLIPEIGRGQEKRVSATARAMKKLAKELASARPETMLLVSPHGEGHYHAMGVLKAPFSSGSLATWGAPGDYRYDNDLALVSALEEEAKALGVPVRPLGERGYSLDHGVLVPMYFLGRGVKGVPLVPLTFSLLSLDSHFSLGKAIGRAAEKVGKRTALIASGDLSHRLIPDAPAGYDPKGKVFDEKLVAAVGRGDARAILNLDEDLIDKAGECGLRSIVILMGALEGRHAKPEVLSYEGPFGVGYLVASFTVEEGAALPGKEGEAARPEPASAPPGLHPLVCLAREAVECYVRKRRFVTPTTFCPEMRERAGVFVSIHKEGELRGCIGTFEPTRPNVADEVVRNAVSSATEDPRFDPVRANELPHLDYKVDLLTPPEPVPDSAFLDARKYGVIVECRGRKGLLLPDLEGVDTVEQQIDICSRKAGIFHGEPVKLYRFQVRRFS